MKFLIWSGRKKSWWKPSGMGYTTDKAHAGYYSIEELQSLTLDGVKSKDLSPAKADVLIPVREGDHPAPVTTCCWGFSISNVQEALHGIMHDPTVTNKEELLVKILEYDGFRDVALMILKSESSI